MDSRTSAWSLSSVNDIHNHRLQPDGLRFYLPIRALANEERTYVEKLVDCHVPVRHIVQILREKRGGQYVHPRDVYNVKTGYVTSKATRDAASGLGEIGDLLDLTADCPEWTVAVAVVEGTTEVRQIFITEDSWLRKFRMFPEVVIADATYKLNRFNMPCIIHIGVDNMGRSFPISFSLVTREDEQQYAYTLRQLRNSSQATGDLIRAPS